MAETVTSVFGGHIVGRERLIAGSDCGFGTFVGYGKLDPDISFKNSGHGRGRSDPNQRLSGHG
jgi:hypothetical protein